MLSIARAVELMKDRAGLMQVDVTAARLLARFESGSVAATLAVLVIVPGPMVRALIRIEAVAPGASEPRAQVTIPLVLAQLPWLGVAETKASRSAKVSVRVTAFAIEGPLFVT